MLHPKFKHKLISFHHASFGRLVTLTLNINKISYRFINVYCPNNCSERKKFIISLESFCHCKMHLFIGGDFNFSENSEMDKLGGNTRRGHVGKNNHSIQNGIWTVGCFPSSTSPKAGVYMESIRNILPSRSFLCKQTCIKRHIRL